MTYNCPECKNKMKWVADERLDNFIQCCYRCDECNIDLEKYMNIEENDDNG